MGFAWLVIPHLSVVLTLPQWTGQPVREDLAMMNSMCADSAGYCLTAPGPWVLTTSSCLTHSSTSSQSSSTSSHSPCHHSISTISIFSSNSSTVTFTLSNSFSASSTSYLP